MASEAKLESKHPCSASEECGMLQSLPIGLDAVGPDERRKLFAWDRKLSREDGEARTGVSWMAIVASPIILGRLMEL